jgi:hypothetical protein
MNKEKSNEGARVNIIGGSQFELITTRLSSRLCDAEGGGRAPFQ